MMGKNSSMEISLPPDFIWGTATAAYQIEGAVAEDGRTPSIWDEFCKLPGAIANGDTGDIACDHYHRTQGDVEILKQLGVDAYRFSIAWPRVLPEGVDRVNQKGLDFYRRLLDALHEAGIAAYATLYHWDLPQVLQDRFGGWAGRDTAYAFAEYADVVSRELGDGVTAWITLNEPWVSSWLSYGWGTHPPGYASLELGMQCAHHLLLAHGLAVPVLRANAPRARVGITLNFSPISAATNEQEDIDAAAAADVNVNLWFLDPLYRGCYNDLLLPGLSRNRLRVLDGDMETIAAKTDFLGVNYYTRFLLSHVPSKGNPFGNYVEVPHAERTAMGWEVYPNGLYDTLSRIHNEYAPGEMIVTENGAAFPDVADADGRVHDTRRIQYYKSHLAQVSRATTDGIPVTGYFAWSLLDNFEWAEGYRPRFGLVYVDYATQRRIIKDSGYWYRDVIASSKRSTASSRPA